MCIAVTTTFEKMKKIILEYGENADRDKLEKEKIFQWVNNADDIDDTEFIEISGFYDCLIVSKKEVE